MWLKPRKTYLTNSSLTPGTTALLGTTTKLTIDRTWPLEEIWVGFWHTNAGTIPTQAGVDGFRAALVRATLTVNDGIQPRNVVDYSGVGLIEYALNTAGNVDRATLENKRVHTASVTQRVWYRIPLVHPGIVGPLRTRMLLDVNNHPQDPVLSLQWAAAASIYSANAPSAVGADVVLCRREMTPLVNKTIRDDGGFIPFDLIETSQTVATASEYRFQVPTPGQYAGLLMRGYDQNTSRASIHDITAGSEGRVRLESGGVVIADWRDHYLAAINEATEAFDHDNATAAATARFPGLYFLDFLTDGIVDADELGSLLDCNLPAASGLKMEIIGTTRNASSVLHVGGHRYFGDLSRYQAKK